MNVVVTLEHRFDRTPDGAVWTQGACAYPFWTRYLEVFDRVRVVARVRDVPEASPDWRIVTGAGVSFAAVPYYIGPWQYLQRIRQVHRAARAAIETHDAVILRVASTIATCLYPTLHKSGHPYAVEVVSDPYDVYAPGSVRHPLRPFFRWQFPRELQKHCAAACAAAYVTQQALQQRYPCPHFSVGVSDVDLPEDAFVALPRSLRSEQRSFTLITVGTMAQLYKAPDVLIDAVAACVNDGLDLKLVLVGDGRYRAELEARAAALGLGKRVCFKGQLPAGQAIRDHLDQADVFVLPSHQEGLPRATVEAMARSLPCIGSTVGGFPELLPMQDLVPPGNVAALATKIREVVTQPQRMAEMSERNLRTASAYRSDRLRKQQIEFYRYVREKTELWINQR